MSGIRSKAATTDNGTRRFDMTSCRATHYAARIHRDYLAHCLRWSYACRQIMPEMRVLDVGCGRDCALARILDGNQDHVPARYVGVDIGPLPHVLGNKWAQFHAGFDFTTRWKELGQFDLIVCYEVIEHMGLEDGRRLLTGLRGCLAEPHGRLYLSTPVFNGAAAKNHIHEYTIPELQNAIESAGLRVARRWGTFASYPEIKRAMTREHRAALEALREYYDNAVVSCIFAPLYPDAARNNLWELAPGRTARF